MNTTDKKILIIDNEPDLTNVLKIALEGLGGFRVQSENNPLLALNAAKQFGPDIIVLDIKMPDLDGADVVIQLKDEPGLSDTPILFFTGTVSTPQAVRYGGKVGGLRFLPKTMRLEAMVACLNDILREGAGHGLAIPAENRAA